MQRDNHLKLYGVAHDVTATKDTEQALAQSEANLRKILDLIPQSVFAQTVTGEFLFVNKAFASLFNLNPEELIDQKNHRKLTQFDEKNSFFVFDDDIIETGISKMIPESSFIDHNGNIRFFHTIKVPYIPAGRNEIAILGIAHDITEQKVADKERTRMIADIVQHNKDLEQFSYIVSHNLRAPVANISGIADILSNIEMDWSKAKKMISYLSTSVSNLDNVIKDLNDIFHTKQQVNERKELISFSKIIEDIKLSISNIIQNEHIEIKTDFTDAENMPALKSYLYSIFYNLILNSIKYKQTDIKSMIEISTMQKDNKINITFKDNGIGIDLKKGGDQVFGLYKRFHHHIEGKGMGLFMVKTQVESMNGKIAIASEVNKGTVFVLEFETI